MPIKLIASDVDGTILPRGGKLSERTISVFQACWRQGIPFVIASGRWYVTALDIAKKLGQTEGFMIIANGGAIVLLDGTPIHEWTFEPEEALRVYRMMKRPDVMSNAFTRNAVYRVNTAGVRREITGLGDYLGGAYSMRFDDEDLFLQKGLNHPYKLEAYSDDPKTITMLRQRFLEAGYSVSSAYADNLEIMPAGCGKGRAVQWLADYLGISLEDCMCFGDNTNDLSMLQAVGWPMAVGNAVDELKRAARAVVGRCEEDGVAIAVEQYALS